MLPRKLWLKVAESLSPDSQLAFYMCDIEFYKLVHHEKVTMLLSKVLPIVVPFIDGKDLLNSRMVCKKWSSVILAFMRDHHSQRPIREGYEYKLKSLLSTREMGLFSVKFRTSEDFRNHIKQMKSSANPLPGNEIEVHLGHNDDDIYECVFQGNQWFTLFGDQVMYITFYMHLSLKNILVTYASMRDWVMKCPHLRLFSIKGSFTQESQNFDRIMKTLEVQINLFDLKFGQSIETLIYDFHNLPTKYFDEVFRALAGTVKKLCFRLDQWTKKTDMLFTQVSELEIYNVMSVVILHDFLKSCFTPGVFFRKLKLNLQVTLDWTDILIILRTLKVDSLELQNCSEKSCNIPMLTNFYKARLKIESLTQLSIFDDFGLSFDFLINFSNLKLLQVCPASKSSSVMENMNHVMAQGVRQIDITIRNAVYKDLKPNYNLWLTLKSLKLFLVRKMVNDKEKVIKYVREEVNKSQFRVLYIRR